jgi:hypothetical protein
MIGAQQLERAPIGTAQAPSLALQASTVPAVAPAQIDINSILNLLIMVMVVVMMMKVMGRATEAV